MKRKHKYKIGDEIYLHMIHAKAIIESIDLSQQFPYTVRLIDSEWLNVGRILRVSYLAFEDTK